MEAGHHREGEGEAPQRAPSLHRRIHAKEHHSEASGHQILHEHEVVQPSYQPATALGEFGSKSGEFCLAILQEEELEEN